MERVDPLGHDLRHLLACRSKLLDCACLQVFQLLRALGKDIAGRLRVLREEVGCGLRMFIEQRGGLLRLFGEHAGHSCGLAGEDRGEGLRLLRKHCCRILEQAGDMARAAFEEACDALAGFGKA